MKINRINVEIPTMKSSITIEKDGEWTMHCTYPNASAGRMFGLWMHTNSKTRASTDSDDFPLEALMHLTLRLEELGLGFTSETIYE
jgi:hypothetical protein